MTFQKNFDFKTVLLEKIIFIMINIYLFLYINSQYAVSIYFDVYIFYKSS